MSKAVPPVPPVRVVADVMALYSVLLNPGGPSGGLMALAHQGRVTLVLCPKLLAELRDVFTRPKLMARRGYTAAEARTILDEIDAVAEHAADAPEIFDFPRDPKDAYLVDLAVAAGASVITSRDNDLLDLMRDTPDGRDFRRRYPEVEVLTPPVLLGRLRKAGAAE